MRVLASERAVYFSGFIAREMPAFVFLSLWCDHYNACGFFWIDFVVKFCWTNVIWNVWLSESFSISLSLIRQTYTKENMRTWAYNFVCSFVLFDSRLFRNQEVSMQILIKFITFTKHYFNGFSINIFVQNVWKKLNTNQIHYINCFVLFFFFLILKNSLSLQVREFERFE